MKLLPTLTTALALAVTPALGANWDCAGAGGPGLAGLRQIHADFNRLFGDARLHIARGQCYAAICGGLTFGVCNDFGYNKWEVANHRNIAKDTDPRGGTLCAIVVDIVNEPHLKYVFSRSISWRPNTDIRYC